MADITTEWHHGCSEDDPAGMRQWTPGGISDGHAHGAPGVAAADLAARIRPRRAVWPETGCRVPEPARRRTGVRGAEVPGCGRTTGGCSPNRPASQPAHARTTASGRKLLAAAGVREARLHDAQHTRRKHPCWCSVSPTVPLWMSWAVRSRHGQALHARPRRGPAPDRAQVGGLRWADGS
jgi:hypothetical protein